MTDRHKRLLDLFKVAIEREQDSQRLYADMALTCEDADLRRIIDSLRESEQTHEEVLLEKYKILRAGTPFRD
jgi:rubrerythrin